MKYRARVQSITVLICALCGQTAWPAAPQSDAVTREMAHDIFKQLIEIKTTDSIGSTTSAAQAKSKRLLAGELTDHGSDRKAMAPPPLRTTGFSFLKTLTAAGN